MSKTENQEDIFSDFGTNLWTVESSPPLLYHYTGIEEAQSIIKNGKTLWASSFENMSDNKEFTYGLRIFTKEISVALSKIYHGKELNRMVSSWRSFAKDEIKNPRLKHYILCFTESGKSDIHWSRYAQHSRGVAIEFRNLFNLKNNVNGFLIKVVYNEGRAKKKLKRRLGKATDIFRQYREKNRNTKDEIVALQLNNLFCAYTQIMFHFLSSFKDPIWIKEQEWRIILTKDLANQGSYPHGDVQHRARGSNTVSYLAVDTELCGYRLSGAKIGCNVPQSSSNDFLNFLNIHSLENIV